MKNKTRKNIKNAAFGVLIGVVNGLFGAGGGMIAVPVLKSGGKPQKIAQQNAVAVILPITVFSAAVSLFFGKVKLSDAAPFVLPGLLGAFLGTHIMKKISPVLLKTLFGGFMIYAGIRFVF